MAHGVDTLEACAVLLEATRLRGAARADGAYQGYFIYIGADTMTSALHAGGVRYPIGRDGIATRGSDHADVRTAMWRVADARLEQSDAPVIMRVTIRPR